MKMVDPRECVYEIEINSNTGSAAQAIRQNSGRRYGAKRITVASFMREWSIIYQLVNKR